MKVSRFVAPALTLVLLCAAGIPTFAVAGDLGGASVNQPIASPELGETVIAPDTSPDEPQPDADQPAAIPTFTAELALSFEGWGLYGTLSEMTEDMTQIVPCYSFDGTEFTPVYLNFWNIKAADPDFLRQQCFWSFESPLHEYLAEEVDSFYVSLQIEYTDGRTVFTEAVPFERAGPAPLPEDCRVAAWYGPGVLDLALNSGQYHFTVPDTIATEALAALLPQTVPVELQIYREGDPTRHTAIVDYTVVWPEIKPLSGGADMDVLAISVMPPEEHTVTIGTEVYRLAPPEILPGNCAELHATFHPIASGAACQVLLSTDEDTENHSIRATFPHKPTGAERIIPEYSLDGESGWKALEDVLASAPLENVPPRFERYTVRVLDGDAAPLVDLASGAIPGFFVRLRIEGGVLAGTTQAAGWPADYDYVPPRDDSGDEGSGGNENNAGSGNNNDSGSSNGGYHPSVPEKAKPSVPPPRPNREFPAKPAQPIVPKLHIEPEPPIEPETPIAPEPPIESEPSTETQMPVTVGSVAELQPTQAEAHAVIPEPQEKANHYTQDVGSILKTSTNAPLETTIAPWGAEKETGNGLPTGLAAAIVLIGTAVTVEVARSANGTAAATGTIFKLLAAIKKIFLRR